MDYDKSFLISMTIFSVIQKALFACCFKRLLKISVRAIAKKNGTFGKIITYKLNTVPERLLTYFLDTIRNQLRSK